MSEDEIKNFNTIKARHFNLVNGVLKLGKKSYRWHIPRALRVGNIKNGDVALVGTQFGLRRVIIEDVFREEMDKEYRVVNKFLETL
jgi:hypothetical protein